MSKIVDLKELNLFDFDVPYIHPYPWLNTITGTNTLGVMGIDIINSLVSPDTVKDSFEILIERSGDTDFEFNVPTTYSYVPYKLANPAPPPTLLKQIVNKMKFNFQMNSQSDQDQDHGGNADTTFERPVASLKMDKLTLGQKFSHVSQMIQRATIFSLFRSNPAPTYVYEATVGTGTVTYTSPTATIKTPQIDDNVAFTVGASTVNKTNTAPMLMFDSGDSRVYAIPAGCGLQFTVTADILYVTIQLPDSQTLYNQNMITSWTSPTTYSTDIPNQYIPFVRITSASVNSPPFHIQTHAFGVAALDSNNNLILDGIDNLSYFSSLYSFARGGINLRLVNTGGPYGVSVIPDNDVNQTSTEKFTVFSTNLNPLTPNDVRKIQSTITQSINPSVEGYGDFTIPFYSSTYCQSIDSDLTFNPNSLNTNFMLPNTQAIITPYGAMGSAVLYRAAQADYQFSYLSGPPLLIAIP